MNANLYICSKSIAHNGTDTYPEVERKIFGFGDFVNKLRSSENNIFYVNSEDLLNTAIFPDKKTIGDLLNGEKIINKDIYKLFLLIFGICKKSKCSLSDMVEYLELEDEDNCHALVVINLITEIEKSKQILSNFEDYIVFRRVFLAKYPKTPEFFISECRKYFSNLILHNENRKTISSILNTHSKSIVRQLGCLNDHFITDFITTELDFIQFLKHFAVKHNLDGASSEGLKDTKFNYTFYEGELARKEYCEPHLKMYKNDSGEDNKHGRIYFSKPEEWKIGTKIYVGYIGQHL